MRVPKAEQNHGGIDKNGVWRALLRGNWGGLRRRGVRAIAAAAAITDWVDRRGLLFLLGCWAAGRAPGDATLRLENSGAVDADGIRGARRCTLDDYHFRTLAIGHGARAGGFSSPSASPWAHRTSQARQSGSLRKAPNAGWAAPIRRGPPTTPQRARAGPGCSRRAQLPPRQRTTRVLSGERGQSSKRGKRWRGESVSV
ncbi:hypothetical protein CC78DRAFT_585486 [Lojkania enalia]|uniref:Uncharacterized protein n=1 Tax=Lojkania enalia TaxID=147567 RepID=A0A9P4N5V2_9PLEO|nr:hypothetical protein CC78DRAFT_585486 [Didymosphaeria enalia]